MVPNTSLKPADDLSVRVYSPQRAIKHPAAMLSELWADIHAGWEPTWWLSAWDVNSPYR
jgi:hypothetical protein